MQLSRFGERFSSQLGIAQLMDDIGEALASNRAYTMLGGGNPANIPAMESVFHDCLRDLLDAERRFEQVSGQYGPPQGEHEFIASLARMMRQDFGWPISSRNIALLNGSQNASFILFNMFAGDMPDGSRRHVQLPLTPEYIGYAEQGLTDDFFRSNQPEITRLDEQLFKYRIDFDALEIAPACGALCVSRPTNPTGNVLTADELDALMAIAREAGVPLILDNAYGVPFPNIMFVDAAPVWTEDIIVCMSLSKLGLPGIRTGIVIAREDVITAIAAINARLNLTTSTFGPALTGGLFASKRVLELSREVIQPFYAARLQQTMECLTRTFTGLPLRVHKPEGAIFLWLWFPDLPIDTVELYQRLKARGVLVIPGTYFFPGIDPQWPHRHECIRMTYSRTEAEVATGITIIAEEVRNAYQHG